MSVILVVDDDAMTLRMLEYSLGSAGHQVVATSDSAQAAALARTHRVDAIILDVLMPGRSGYEVLAELHAGEETASIPVLMLSSLAQSSHRVKGLREGADEYLTKPFDPEELQLRLNRLLNLDRGNQADFAGNLATIPFAEVTQSLLHSTTEGVLEVAHGNRRGHIVLEEGRAKEATFGRLHGTQAVLAMLELTSGSFRFVRRPRDLSATDHGVDLDLQQAMFTSVWLQDELGRWPELPEGTLLWAAGTTSGAPTPPAGYDRLPILTVWQEVAHNPGCSARSLLDRELAAPRVLRLTLRVLFHSGAICSVSPQESADDLNRADRELLSLRAAVAATVQTAREIGNLSDLLHILIVANGEAQAALLEIRQRLPKAALAAAGDSLTGAWSSGRIAAVPLVAPSGELVLHLAAAQSQRSCHKIKRQITDYAAVIVWVNDPDVVDDMDWLIQALDATPVPQWGVLVSNTDEAAAAGVALTLDAPRWSQRQAHEPTLAELLRLLAAAPRGG